MKLLTKLFAIVVLLISYSTTKAQTEEYILQQAAPYEDKFNVDVFKQDISELTDESGVINIDEENNAYVQGATEIEYLSYPEHEQPDYQNLTQEYSQENPRIIYDHPRDMEIQPDPAQCPELVVCPDSRKGEESGSDDFMYRMEIEEEDENL